MDTQEPIDDSSPILTDEALGNYAAEGAQFEVTLTGIRKHTGRLVKDEDVWNIVVVKMDGNSAVERGVRRHQDGLAAFRPNLLRIAEIEPVFRRVSLCSVIDLFRLFGD